MRLVLQIAAGIFLGSVALYFFFEYMVNRDLQRAGEEFTAAIAKSNADVERQAIIKRQALDHAAFLRDEQNRLHAIQIQQSMQLTGSQECVGGVVMQAMFAQGVHSVVQLFENAKPVRCTGDRRLTPP